MGNISFYQRLVGVTLGPLLVLAFLSATYVVAMRVHRCRGGRGGRESSEARQRAVVRHASAALLVLFLVSFIFSSFLLVFFVFACVSEVCAKCEVCASRFLFSPLTTASVFRRLEKFSQPRGR